MENCEAQGGENSNENGTEEACSTKQAGDGTANSPTAAPLPAPPVTASPQPAHSFLAFLKVIEFDPPQSKYHMRFNHAIELHFQGNFDVKKALADLSINLDYS